MSSKKMYNLAGIDTNVEKLREDQLHELTRLLITLKSEYDELIRESLKKKKETEEIAKQIVVMEKIDRRIGENKSSLELNLHDIKKQIEMKQVRLEEELFQRDSLIHLASIAKDDILSLQKKLNANEITYNRNQKEFQKQKFKSTEIKEKLNQIHLKMNHQKKVFSFKTKEKYS